MAMPSRRTVRDLRRSSRKEVLQRLYFDGPMSRQALGTTTSLSSGSISTIAAELVAEGLVEEAGTVDSDGGRPRTLLRVVPSGAYLIGVDVGETRVRVELFDLVMTELARWERPMRRNGYDVASVVRHISDGVGEVLSGAGITADLLLGVGVGIPGIVDRGADGGGGAVVHGQTIGWDAVPLESLLRECAVLPPGTRFFIENGARTLGQAEMWFGGGRGVRDAAIVLFGSGIGACIVTDGAVFGGAGGSAAEWGHTTLHVRGRRCRCGALGCLEAYAGAEALVQRWQEAGASLPADTDEETAVTALLAAAYPPAGEADPVARAVLDETAEYLGAGISDLINLYGPERVLLCGWAGLQLAPYILDSVRTHAAAYALRHPAGRVSIELGRLGPDAVTVGAATLPLADFFARGGRLNEQPGEGDSPAGQAGWRATMETRKRTITAQEPATK
ncbi:ROK family transcriptional regulator [Streptomyces albidochromogenes]|uniref:ROK family transcriptional regulator n=1 Tax=Streptomyces albidochromogenes TaxID=329524 RepID=UPI00110FE294|nr:ROK family protein [Streptomyces albidochromogenes]